MADGLRFFQDGAFDPDTTSAMGAAFERACKSLHDMGRPDIVKEIIAKRSRGRQNRRAGSPFNSVSAHWRR
jgi:hypothetical protein